MSADEIVPVDPKYCECSHPEHVHGKGRFYTGCEMAGCPCRKYVETKEAE